MNKRVIDGWILLDKPLGLTSTQALGRARRILGAGKAGHGGTLDPLATGILPLAFGEATKAIPYVMDATKDYEFTVRWGAETATDDLEGDVTATSGARPARGDIKAALPRFVGRIEQTPPAFSAIKIDGARAYDLARAGAAVALQSRRVEIHDLRVVDPDGDDGHDPLETRLAVRCGKGTYVRAIARDLGRALGCFGHVSALRRTRVGPFRIDQSFSLDKLAALSDSARLVLPVVTALDDIPALAATEADATRMVRGQAFARGGLPDGTYRVMAGERLVAVARAENGTVRSVRVFNL